MNKSFYLAIYIVISFLRVISALTVFISPIFAASVSIILDTLDGINASRGGLKRFQYQVIDKSLDLFWYTISLIFILYNSIFEEYRLFILFLYLFRLIGTISFFVTKKKKYLFYFGNYYENILIILFLGKFTSAFSFLLSPSFFLFSVIIALTLKFITEFLLHFINYSITEKVLGLKMRWLEEKS